MPKLVSDWVRVAKAGSTIDKRTIEESWLVDAGEQYSTTVYTAVLTYEHNDPEFWGTLGTVAAMEYRKEKDGVFLYAKFQPTEELIYLNKQGRKLFPSIKVDPSFADTGRAYVTQIGLTDKPASLGVQMLEFHAQTDKNLFPGEEIESLTFSEESETSSVHSEQSEQSLLKKIKALVFSAPTSTDSEDGDEPMKPEELKACIAEAFTEGFSALEEKLKPAEPPAAEPEAPAPEAAESVSTEQFAALQTELADIKTQFAALTEKLAQPVPPTEVENPGIPAEDKLGF